MKGRGRSSRRKGAKGELEVAAIMKAHDFEAERDGRLSTDLKHNVTGYHFEIKRCEKIEMMKWRRQAERDAPEGEVPVVVYRQSGQRWHADIDLEELLRLMNGTAIVTLEE